MTMRIATAAKAYFPSLTNFPYIFSGSQKSFSWLSNSSLIPDVVRC